MAELDRIRKAFGENLESVSKLINFDREVQDYTISNVEELHRRLKTGPSKIDNPKLNGERTLQILKNIRQNDSLRTRFEVVYNQALVLLVSHFSSAVGDVFRFAVAKELDARTNLRLLKEELRISLEEIIDVPRELAEAIPDIFVAKKDISFQDMQSIHRAFKDYVDITLNRDEVVNDIIVSQACRHVIVHSGGIADARFMRQIKAANPRRLKPEVKEKEPLKFSPDELASLADTMSVYVDRLCSSVTNHIEGREQNPE